MKQKIAQPLTNRQRFDGFLKFSMMVTSVNVIVWSEGSPVHCSPSVSSHLPLLDIIGLHEPRRESLVQDGKFPARLG